MLTQTRHRANSEAVSKHSDGAGRCRGGAWGVQRWCREVQVGAGGVPQLLVTKTLSAHVVSVPPDSGLPSFSKCRNLQ